MKCVMHTMAAAATGVAIGLWLHQNHNVTLAIDILEDLVVRLGL